MHSLSQGVVTVQRDYLSQSYSFVEKYMHSPRRGLLYKNNANTFRMTILFFCKKYVHCLKGSAYS